MSREDLIRRIEKLSEVDLRRVSPFIESELALLSEPEREFDKAILAAEIRAGKESARTEPLEQNDDVSERIRRQLLLTVP